MNILVDGIQYSIGGHHTGDGTDVTYIRFTTYIDGEFVFLDDVSAFKHHGEGNHPIYTREEQAALKEDLKNRLAANIQKIINTRSSNGRS